MLQVIKVIHWLNTTYYRTLILITLYVFKTYVCVPVSTHTYVCACRAQRSMSNVLLSFSPPYLWSLGLVELPNSARLPGQRVPGSSRLCLPTARIIGTQHRAWLLCGHWESNSDPHAAQRAAEPGPQALREKEETNTHFLCLRAKSGKMSFSS